jgi:hypothetical protein
MARDSPKLTPETRAPTGNTAPNQSEAHALAPCKAPLNPAGLCQS